MENLIEMDDLGGTPIFGNTHLISSYVSIDVGQVCLSKLSKVFLR